MQDVARIAGVARSTVSMALRNDRRIPAATRAKVFAAAEQLGYKTNPLISALMTSLHARINRQRHTVLGYVTSDPEVAPWRSYRMFIEMQEGAASRAQDLGYRLEEFALRAAGMTPRRFTQILRARGILGLLIAPLQRNERSIELDFKDFAVVGIDMSVTSPPIERVSNDHLQSALLAFRECRKLGYRRIGFILSREVSERLDLRWLAACRLVLSELPPEERVEPLLPPRSSAIIPALPEWFAREKPDAVILGELDPHGHYPLPPQVGMVSLSLEEPALGHVAGIFQDNRQMGSTAVDRLVARLERCEFGTDDRGRLHLVAGRWFAGPTAPGVGRERVGLR